MRFTKTVPAAIFAMLATAACDRSDALVTPQPSVPTTPISAPDRVRDTDDEQARVAREEIPGYAGYYLGTDGTPVVRVVNPEQAEAAQAYVMRNIGVARSNRLPLAAIKASAAPRVLPATYDFAQLKDWAEQLNPLLSREGVYLIDVDEVNNRVLLGVSGAGAAGVVRAEAVRLGIPADAIGTQTQAAPEVRATVRDRFTTFVGGIQIAFGQYLCTAGFNAKRVSNGANIFVTNSHCSTTQYANDGVAIYQNTVAAGNQVGNEVADRALYACVSGVASCRLSDAIFVSHNGTRTIGQGGIARTNWATGSAAPSLTTIGEFDIIGRYTGTLPVNSYLDKTGRTSGSTYGLVTNSCVTIGVLRCQDISKVWSEGGDSGSPVYVYIGGAGAAENDVQLHGVMWGGPGSDWTTTYSSRLSGIEADLGALNSLCRPGYGC